MTDKSLVYANTEIVSLSTGTRYSLQKTHVMLSTVLKFKMLNQKGTAVQKEDAVLSLKNGAGSICLLNLALFGLIL